jgi:hypothetical protein
MSILLPHKVSEIPQPFLIVCEGYGDARFLCALLKFRNITNCNVGCPSEAGGTGTGRDAISAYLRSVQAVVQLKKATLRGLLVVADADGDATAAFNLMSAALWDAAFSTPARPFTIEGTPMRVGIFLIPGNGRLGCLEHILWDAAVQKTPAITKCVDDFFICTGSHIGAAPSSNKQAKMRMSTIVAAHCKDNPWASAALIWADAGNPVPIDSSRFSELGDFLATFVA